MAKLRGHMTALGEVMWQECSVDRGEVDDTVPIQWRIVSFNLDDLFQFSFPSVLLSV